MNATRRCKICFVDLDANGREFFTAGLPDQEVVFVPNLADVPQDAEIVSIFINEFLGGNFLDAHPAVKLVATRSTGYDHIDIEACRARGVEAVMVADFGENTVAEHTFALMLALTRRLRDCHEAVKLGRFSREDLRGIDLRGRTLGVVGAGRIGLHVIRLARAFGLKVVAYDSAPRPYFAGLLDFTYTDWETLLRTSDLITLHIPLNPTTRHLINRESLALCQPGVVLINTARGGLMETQAVVDALEAGQLGGLGLDVLEDERVFKGGGVTSMLGEQIAERVHNAARGSAPASPSASRLAEFSQLVTYSRLIQRPDVILTPHVAYNSEEAVTALRRITAEHIRDYLAGRPLKNLCT